MPGKTTRDRWRFAPTAPMQPPARGNRKTGLPQGQNTKPRISCVLKKIKPKRRARPRRIFVVLKRPAHVSHQRVCDVDHSRVVLSMLCIENSTPTRWSMKKQILVATASALTAAVVMLNGTNAATAQQPQYQVGSFPITTHQMLVLQPSARMREQQRLGMQPTMDASRRRVYPDPGLANTGY
jgi:hypothetical protein